jgi:hypothetical protein
MKKSLIISLEDENTSLFSKQYRSLPDIHEEIDKLFEEVKQIDGRKKKQVAEWKERINFLIHMYNSRSKFKTYNKV